MVATTPDKELLPKNDPPEFSPVLKEKKSSPPSRRGESDLWSSAPEVLKKLAIIAFSEELVVLIQLQVK